MARLVTLEAILPRTEIARRSSERHPARSRLDATVSQAALLTAAHRRPAKVDTALNYYRLFHKLLFLHLFISVSQNFLELLVCLRIFAHEKPLDYPGIIIFNIEAFSVGFFFLLVNLHLLRAFGLKLLLQQNLSISKISSDFLLHLFQ